VSEINDFTPNLERVDSSEDNETVSGPDIIAETTAVIERVELRELVGLSVLLSQSNLSEEEKESRLARLDELSKDIIDLPCSVSKFPYYFPKQFTGYPVKKNYRLIREVEAVTGDIHRMQFVSADSLISLNNNGPIYEQKKDSEGNWKPNFLFFDEDKGSYARRGSSRMGVFSTGSIILMGEQRFTIRHPEQVDGRVNWKEEHFKPSKDVDNFQIISENSFAFSNYTGLFIYSRRKDGQWVAKRILKKRGIIYFQLISDDEIIVADKYYSLMSLNKDGSEWKEKLIREELIELFQMISPGKIIIAKDNELFLLRENKLGKWVKSVIYKGAVKIRDLQVLPDGRIAFICRDRKLRILDGDPIRGRNG